MLILSVFVSTYLLPTRYNSFLMDNSRPFFLLLSLKVQFKFCQWLDSNRGPLESEGTALSTEPQPLTRQLFDNRSSMSSWRHPILCWTPSFISGKICFVCARAEAAKAIFLIPSRHVPSLLSLLTLSSLLTKSDCGVVVARSATRLSFFCNKHFKVVGQQKRLEKVGSNWKPKTYNFCLILFHFVTPSTTNNLFKAQLKLSVGHDMGSLIML